MKSGRVLRRWGRREFLAYVRGFDVLLSHGGNLPTALPQIRGIFNGSGIDRTRTSLEMFWQTLMKAFVRWAKKSN